MIVGRGVARFSGNERRFIGSPPAGFNYMKTHGIFKVQAKPEKMLVTSLNFPLEVSISIKYIIEKYERFHPSGGVPTAETFVA